ncbi:MAG: biopolymer transporter ExbD [Acidobacteriota bacterium]
MAFSQSSSGLPSSEINVTPLIDVLLVLLIIFMVIVPVVPKGVDSKVPQGKASDAVLSPVVVQVQARGGGAGADAPAVYRVDGKVMELAELRPALQTLLSANPERPLFIAADRGLSYDPVAAAVGEAKEAGAVSVVLEGSKQ